MANFKGKIFSCGECGKEFKAPQCRSKTAKYCSKECADVHRHDKTRVKKAELCCERCGKVFRDHPCHRDRRKFCSYKCAHESHIKIEKRVCAFCEEVFEVNPSSVNICCSVECRNARAKTSSWPLSKKLLRQCVQCGKEFWRKLSAVNKSGGKFCSRDCKHKSQEVVNSTSSHFYSTVKWKRDRKRILLRDNSTCQQCGFNGSSLHIHHKEFKRNGGLESDENLVTLCAHCHRLLHCSR